MESLGDEWGWSEKADGKMSPGTESVVGKLRHYCGKIQYASAMNEG